MQLSAKALLRPFSALSKDNDDRSNEDEDAGPEGGSEMILDNEDGESDIEPEDEDNEVAEAQADDEEDPLDVLDEEGRKKLMEDTLAVRTTLNKVCTDISSFLTIVSLDFRFENYLLESSTRRLLHFLHGARPAQLINFLSASFHAMSRLAGTQLTTW